MENITGLIKIYLQILFQFTNKCSVVVVVVFISLSLSFVHAVCPPSSTSFTTVVVSISLIGSFSLSLSIHTSNEYCIDKTLCRYTIQTYSTVLMLSIVNVNGLLWGFSHQNAIRCENTKQRKKVHILYNEAKSEKNYTDG